jgi:hypothetical protein
MNPWHDTGPPLVDMLSAAIHSGLRLAGNRRLGPLPATARRTAFLLDAGRWTPPEPRPPIEPERRAALTEGTGLEALRLLVPPPAAPYLGDGSWERLFDELGTRLPAEYVLRRPGLAHRRLLRRLAADRLPPP